MHLERLRQLASTHNSVLAELEFRRRIASLLAELQTAQDGDIPIEVDVTVTPPSRPALAESPSAPSLPQPPAPTPPKPAPSKGPRYKQKAIGTAPAQPQPLPPPQQTPSQQPANGQQPQPPQGQYPHDQHGGSQL